LGEGLIMTNLVELARGRIGKLPGVVSVGLADISGMEYLSVTLKPGAKKGDVVRAIKSLEKEGDGAIPYAIWRKGEPVPEETRPGIPEPKPRKKGGSMGLVGKSMAIRRMLGKEGKEAVEAMVVEFLSGNPTPSDPEVHEFAEGIGEDTEAVEAAFYALAGKFVEVLMAGRANEKGFSVEDADPDELAMGIKVEMEHTGNKDLAQRIALDHLAEADKYYSALKEMEAGLGIEGREVKAKMIPALEFIEGAGSTQPLAVNRFDSGEQAAKYVRKLESLGAKVFIDETYGEGPDKWADAIMVKLPRSITPDLLKVVAEGRADDMGMQGEYFRMWWD
jgi:hypothetical protein